MEAAIPRLRAHVLGRPGQLRKALEMVILSGAGAVIVGFAAAFIYSRVAPPSAFDLRDPVAFDGAVRYATTVTWVSRAGAFFAFLGATAGLAGRAGYRPRDVLPGLFPAYALYFCAKVFWRAADPARETVATTITLPEPAEAETMNRFLTADDFPDDQSGTLG